MRRKLITILASGLLVVGSASAATAHHQEGHTANQHGLCTAEANGGNPGGNGNGNATPPECEEEQEPDTEAPSFVDASVDADGVVTVTYSEPIVCDDVDPSDYEGTLVRDGQELGTEGAATATCDGETSTTVQLTADEGTTNALEPGDELVITITDTNDVQDEAGNEQPEDDEVTATVPES